MSYDPLETLRFDLQLHAEQDPPDPQPIEPGQQVIEGGEESSKIFDPGTASEPGKQGHPQGPKEPDGSSDPTQYEIDGVQFNSSDVKRWKELDKSGGNKENWEAALHRRGQELNERETTLKQSEGIKETDLNLLTQYREFKSVVDASPDARKYFEALVKNPQNAMQPALDKIQADIKDRFSALDEKDADIRLTQEFKDYDAGVHNKALEAYSADNPYDVQKLKYYAWKGINIEAEIQRRIASGQTQQGPALPPLASGVPPEKRPKAAGSMSEAVDNLYKDLGLQV